MNSPQIGIAHLQDATALADLLEQLGYPGTHSFMEEKLIRLLRHPDEVLLVAKRDNLVLGFISLHFIPQLALEGDFCRISYFCISEDKIGQGIGKLLENAAEDLARKRGCDRIELHCHSRREKAHRFYARQGYQESPKYLMKKL